MVNVVKFGTKVFTRASKSVYSAVNRAGTYIFGHTPKTLPENFLANLENCVPYNGKVGRLITLPDGTKLVDEVARKYPFVHSEPNILKRLLYKFVRHKDIAGAKAFAGKVKSLPYVHFESAKSISELKRFAKDNLGIIAQE